MAGSRSACSGPLTTTGPRPSACLGSEVAPSAGTGAATSPRSRRLGRWTASDSSTPGEERLLEAEDTASGTIWRHAYDAGGERVASWRRDGSGGLAEVRLHLRDESGAVLSDWTLLPASEFGPTRDYVRTGDRVVAQLDWTDDGPSPRFLAHDHLGSTRVVIGLDGTITDLLEYYPFGGLRAGGPVPGTSHLFTGHERDLGATSSELDYMHARYYSPALGRFTSLDAVGGDPAFSQSWNRYTYTRNNPLRAVDPDGRYRRDVHLDLTRVLAAAAGFDSPTAVAIATADVATDSGFRSSTTAAGIVLGSGGDYHFTSPRRRQELRRLAFSSRSAEAIGMYLHALQDSYSHEGYTASLGHLRDGTRPDITAEDPPKALNMARETYKELQVFRRRGDSAVVPWSEISDFVGEYLSLTEDRSEERDAILVKIEAACRDYRDQQE